MVDLTNQPNNNAFHNERVKALLAKDCSWSEMWLKFGQENYPYDDNFMAVSNYALKNKIIE